MLYSSLGMLKGRPRRRRRDRVEALILGMFLFERAVGASRGMIQAGWRCDVGTYDAVMGALGRL